MSVVLSVLMHVHHKQEYSFSMLQYRQWGLSKFISVQEVGYQRGKGSYFWRGLISERYSHYTVVSIFHVQEIWLALLPRDDLIFVPPFAVTGPVLCWYYWLVDALLCHSLLSWDHASQARHLCTLHLCHGGHVSTAAGCGRYVITPCVCARDKVISLSLLLLLLSLSTEKKTDSFEI